MNTYRSARRQQQAQATRQDIIRAARELFAERGYSATSMTDIARAAEVAVQTIYSSCGSKRELALALVDAIDEEADVAALSAQIASSEDPRELIELGTRLTRQLNEQTGDIIAALISAAAAEPDAAAALADGKKRHRAGAARLGHKLAELGALRDDITPDQAGALIAALTWQTVYIQLTQEHGWSLDDAEHWIRTTLTETLLR